MRQDTMKLLAAGLLAGALALGPGRAEACGGLFCNGPPADPFAPLPVAQSGENIVFAVDNAGTGSATVTAYIQILYSGLASQFSWVIPVAAVPTISVGTDRIFTQAAQLTQPTYRANWVTDGTCKSDLRGISDGQSTPTNGGSTGAGGAGGVVIAPGVNVAFRGDVGPYDVSVIQSASSAALLKWLSDNGYFVGDDAKTIIEEYVALNKYFVAVKLLSGQETGAIQPIVLRFAGEVPCVPLKLTAIAALADLQVNLWVLGTSRAVPSNYFEITLNQAKIDWLNGGSNYTDMVKAAANDAGGNAFIAEYAGTARVLDGTLWPNAAIDLTALGAATTPPAFLQLVVAQGLLQYGPMLPLLRTHIPEPQTLKDMGITESQFYNGNASYWAQYQSSFAPFDASVVTMLTADIKAKIVDPLQAGQLLLDGHSYLTRLATYISPEEMNQDPEFVFNPDLPELPNVHTATAHVVCGNQAFTYCEAPIRLDLPEGGSSVWFSRNNCTPDRTGLDQMPSLSVAYLRAEAGEGTLAIDNRPAIRAAVAGHNDSITGCGCNVAPGASAGALALLAALALLGRTRRPRRR
jgi:MYXO-CTERM domain-containing protein